MCVFSGVCNNGAGGPGGSHEWRAPSALFAHMVQLMFPIKTVVWLPYITHIYIQMCVYAPRSKDLIVENL